MADNQSAIEKILLNLLLRLCYPYILVRGMAIDEYRVT